MGTRHLISAYQDGEYMLAQYGQWDGYPEGQGVSILDFLRNGNLEGFRRNLKRCRYISNEEYDDLWEQIGVDTKTTKYVNIDVSDKFYGLHPELSRDTGSNILKIIADNDAGLGLLNRLSFVGDSLFCEWAYVIDFDKNTFEVYKGFNIKPLGPNERFNFIERDEDSKYYPVKLCATFDLSNLPTQEEFLDKCNVDDDEEELPDVSAESLLGILAG